MYYFECIYVSHFPVDRKRIPREQSYRSDFKLSFPIIALNFFCRLPADISSFALSSLEIIWELLNAYGERLLLHQFWLGVFFECYWSMGSHLYSFRGQHIQWDSLTYLSSRYWNVNLSLKMKRIYRRKTLLKWNKRNILKGWNWGERKEGRKREEKSHPINNGLKSGMFSSTAKFNTYSNSCWKIHVFRNGEGNITITKL